ncbi:extracellular solute-binding protein [uncultured Victivallis sp.]|uniref:ABC transporter substrate-binding protein n=1 Tax=uncultured Victivallis sp. TaxID=354118 RepID=UPI002586FF2D|nr:extracellular solute-binding protein [uncultured Victivallis sp.]
MLKKILVAALPIFVLLAIPFFLRPASGAPSDAPAEKLVIISAHNESIKYEYDRAFRQYYRDRFGRDIELDFRSPGGTSDIVKYIADRYEAEFRHFFESDPANGEWTPEIAKRFAEPGVENDPTAPEAVRKARKLFLSSDVGIGIDLMAGGGTFDMQRHAKRGFAVDGGAQKRHPEYFADDVIPRSFGGDELYDKDGRYYGIVLSTFGICYNADRIAELADPAPPKRWADLAAPRFYNTIALADPSKSGSANKCFEILIQQCMADSGSPDKGWEEGLNLIKRIFGNARNLTDSAGKIPRDVAAGNAAAGMAIDTYGFTEQEWNELQFGGTPHFFYVPPEGGTAVSADPVQMLRGAPNRKAAEAFIDFLLSIEGQKLHAFKTGTPGGPARHALRRPPIRRDLYAPEYREYRSDPNYNPYESGASFVYRPELTGPYYGLLRILIRAIALDPQPELQRAWKAIIDAGGPEKVPQAMRAFNRLPFPYSEIADANRALRRDAVEVAAVIRSWSESARLNYLEAERLAKEGK